MAITSERLAELRQDFEKIKYKIDAIDRKYSIEYVEPTLDMPESLNLPPFEYVEKSEEQLLTLAEQKISASHLSTVNSLQSRNATNNLRIDKQLLAVEEKTRVKIARLLNKLNVEITDVTTKITNAGMLFSTVAERLKSKLSKKCEEDVNACNLSADNERANLEAERAKLNENYNQALQGAETLRQSRLKQAYNKLLEDEQAERERVIKYNNILSEKETKYQMSRAKAFESARQAEYDRAYKAKKLYQQMGATGYEENVLWEKYNLFVSYFGNFNKREEALALIQEDAYVRSHLKQYYTTLVDWVNRNVPA